MKTKNIPALLLLLLVILVIIYFILSKCTGTKTLAATCINAYAIMGTRTTGSTSSTDSVPPAQGSTTPTPIVNKSTVNNLAVVHSTNDSSGGTIYCTGTGICSSSLVQTSPDQVPIVICNPPDTSSTVTISFSMSALKQKQPDHVRYIEHQTEYTFGADCIFSDTACKKLGYQKNTRIQGKKAGKIKISADTVVITMPIVKQ